MTTDTPNFAITVNNSDVSDGVMRAIKKVEYESVDGYADTLKMSLANPDFQLTNKKIFKTGNEISLWMGYGADLSYIGRTIIEKARPTFPKAGAIPTIDLVAYTKDRKMMLNAPLQNKKARGKSERFWPADTPFSEVISARGRDYGFNLDIDRTPTAPDMIIQRVGMTDYDFVRGLSNETGFLFWVDGDENGQWTLHFKDPNTVGRQIQQQKFNLIYNQDNDSQIYSFSGEEVLSDTQTTLEVQVKRPNGKFQAVTVEPNRVKTSTEFFNDIEEEAPPLGDPTEVTIAFGDTAVKVVTSRNFKTEAQMKLWAESWFQRNNERFITGDAEVVGIEKIFARQIHGMTGMGDPYDGDYYFYTVTHRMNPGIGYEMNTSGRKIPPQKVFRDV